MIYYCIFVATLIILTTITSANVSNNVKDIPKPFVRVNKCCGTNELFVFNYCTPVNETKETKWEPLFTNEFGKTNEQFDPFIATGSPDCGSHQQWPIYHYHNSSDVLYLLPSGKLRHYSYRPLPGEEYGHDFDVVTNKNGFRYQHDYESGQYCLDKRIEGDKISEYALVCGPEQEITWTNTEYLMRNVINPVTHGISIICLLIVAIVYFIMPTLRDLVGNIVTTVSICLIVSQAADLIRLLTVFNSHISLIITETVCYITLLGAFFWLNSLGYYIWKTFKSRNVYLRITDGKKYCYYSAYAWTCTLIMGFLAVFAHYTMDYPTRKPMSLPDENQEQIGSLGMIIFFMPVAFTVLVNIFFFATTLKILGRMNTYGRIHHKLKHSFRMFSLLFIIMTLTWVFFLMSFSKFDGLIYCYIIVNAFQAPIIMYVCVFNQKHVSFLIRKTCCYTNCLCTCCRPEPEIEWGDEMTAMNAGIYYN